MNFLKWCKTSRRAATKILFAVLIITSLHAAPAGDNAPAQRGAWTLDQALSHLKLYPHDAYVQYVALQLARREGKVAEVAQKVAGAESFQVQMQRRAEAVDLFSIFSGALAVQESLQLDAMLADQPNAGGRVGVPNVRQPGAPQPPRRTAQSQDAPMVAISKLAGPGVKSHPWEQMLAGRKPQVSLLARSVPDDFYFAEFRSVNKLTEASKIADLWGTHLLNQAEQEAQTQLVDQRLPEQLAVETNPLLAPFYDSIVERIAITGSDVFVREGTDITLLFQIKQPAIFRAQMEKFLATAATKSGAKRTSGTYRQVAFESVQTADRRIHVFSAYPKSNLHVRTNSRVALERIIDAIQGHTADGKPIRRLGDTTEFAYIRTLLPPDAPEEDGLIYLSDPFMRRMVGPQLRLTERHRMFCYNHLKMISHAALMYRTEHGKNPASLAELAAAGCVPGEFGTGSLSCPDGGKYTLSDDGLAGSCSKHGYAHNLTPCSEIELHEVVEDEANAYRQFVEQYNQYWRLYFDPIAVRLTISPQRYRAETIVLPLIDNSVYTALASSLGGKPEQLDALPVPKRNIFSFAVRIDKSALLRQLQMEELIEEPEPAAEQAHRQVLKDVRQSTLALKQLALGMLMYHDTHKAFPMAAINDAKGHPLLSWRVALLPYLEEQALYDQFHRDEPWDSEHNKKLISRMPAFFRPSNPKLVEMGKTKFVVPRGTNTVFPADNQKVSFKNITDGSSQTVQIVEASDDRAVIWTRPDDIEVDPNQPGRRLESRSGDGYLMALCDGSVQRIDPKIDNATLAATFTRSGGEAVDIWKFIRPAHSDNFARRGMLSGMPLEVARDLSLGRFLSKGIGNQVSFNVYDAQQLFDLSLPKAVGLMVGSFRGNGPGRFSAEMLPAALVAGSLNSPVYLAIPVRNREIVDEFLTRIDAPLAEQSHEREREFFQVDNDFYHLPSRGSAIRAWTIGFGPLKLRFFWQRIGDALYITSQREILEDLAAFESRGGPAPTTSDPPAHALVRLRPQHWNQVLGRYRLGWEENNRQACLKNLGPLSSLARAMAPANEPNGKPLTTAKLMNSAARLYDVRYFCPDDGMYTIAADGTVTCSKHGSAAAPHQGDSPAPTSELGNLLGEFSDMSVSLTFLEDGLHAVVNLERTKR
jgi:hypothetical protein